MDNELYIITTYDSNGVRMEVYCLNPDREELTALSKHHPTVKLWRCIEVIGEKDEQRRNQ